MGREGRIDPPRLSMRWTEPVLPTSKSPRDKLAGDLRALTKGSLGFQPVALNSAYRQDACATLFNVRYLIQLGEVANQVAYMLRSTLAAKDLSFTFLPMDLVFIWPYGTGFIFL